MTKVMSQQHKSVLQKIRNKMIGEKKDIKTEVDKLS